MNRQLIHDIDALSDAVLRILKDKPVLRTRSVTITRCPTLGVYKVFIQGWIFRRIHIFPADLFNLQHNPGTPRFINTFTPPARMTEMTSVFEAKGTCPTCDPGTCRDVRRTVVTRIPRWASPLIHAELEKLLNAYLQRP
jgi:hypothetical protein